MISAQSTLDPKTFWRSILDTASVEGSKPIAFFDLDEFIFEHDSIVLGAEEFAVRLGRPGAFTQAYEQFKLHKLELEMGELLALGVTDALANFKGIEDYVAWVAPRQKLRPGFEHFLSLLQANDVSAVIISNGVKPITEALMDYHGLTMPLASNDMTLSNSKVNIHCLSNWKIGVDKGALVRMASQWGYTICGGGGDSRNDIGLAQAVSEAEGFVMARRNLGLAKWCKSNLDGRFCEFDDFRETEAYVLKTLENIRLVKP